MAPSTRKIYEFPTQTFIENIAIRSDGTLLLTTFHEASLYSLDPNTPNAEPVLVAQLPGASALTGIVEVSPDIFAVAGGPKSKPFRFDDNAFKVWLVDLSKGLEKAEVVKTIDASIVEFINGMAGVPENPHIILGVESLEGKIVRVNTKTGECDIVLDHAETMGKSENPKKVPCGANGAAIQDGWFYFTNSAKQLFCRVKIDVEGNVVGEVEVLVTNENAEKDVAYDDFDLDSEGNAYVTVHSNSVFKIGRDGKQELFAGGGEGYGVFEEPTALAVSKDDRKLYVACAKKGDVWGASEDDAGAGPSRVKVKIRNILHSVLTPSGRKRERQKRDEL